MSQQPIDRSQKRQNNYAEKTCRRVALAEV